MADRLVRPRHGRMIAGVAAGLARRFGISVLIVRLIWILLLLPGGVPGLLPYIVLWILVPSERETTAA